MFKRIVAAIKEIFWIQTTPAVKKRAARKTQTKKKRSLSSTSATGLRRGHPVAKKLTKPARVAAPLSSSLTSVGKVTHYFDRIKVCVIKIQRGTILIGDRLTIGAKAGSFVQKIWSMQIESLDVKIAQKGQLIGIKVDKPVAAGDIVYKQKV